MQVNTHQVVVASDGLSTYALFLYRDIQWGDNRTSIGFNAGDGLRGFNFFDPFNPVVPGVNYLVKKSNVGVPGMYIFKVDEEFIEEPGILKFL